MNTMDEIILEFLEQEALALQDLRQTIPDISARDTIPAKYYYVHKQEGRPSDIKKRTNNT